MEIMATQHFGQEQMVPLETHIQLIQILKTGYLLFNEVKLNSKYLSNQTDAYKQGVVAHEMGHCFGLNENNTNPYSIMCQAGHGRAVTTVQQVDQNAFNRKHP